jgi:hypothetical protein
MIRVEQTYTPKGRVRYHLHIDKEIFHETDYKRADRRLWFHLPSPQQSNEINVTVCDSSLIKKLSEHTFTQLPKQITNVSFDIANSVGLDCSLIGPKNHLSIAQDEGRFKLYCYLETVPENWATPLSQAEFLIEVYRKLIRHYEVTIVEESTANPVNNAVSIRCPIKNPEATIEAEISTFREQIQKVLDQAVAYISQTFDREPLAVFFDFPEPIKIACEQYLLYFGQFLNDLGVSATTSLTHQMGQVLFTVTPTNREEALDRIKEALDLYLELASSPISDSTNESIAVQRLESSVLRLRSDLKLAAAELQAKDATIKAQTLMISILNGEILVHSLKDVSPKPEEKEDVIPGVVSLSTYKEKGLEVNLGEMFRRLKRFLRHE